jgi:hypothetical protein
MIYVAPLENHCIRGYRMGGVRHCLLREGLGLRHELCFVPAGRLSQKEAGC